VRGRGYSRLGKARADADQVAFASLLGLLLVLPDIEQVGDVVGEVVVVELFV